MKREHLSGSAASPPIPLVLLTVQLLQPDLLAEGRDDEREGKHRMGDLLDLQVCDDAQAQKDGVASEVSRVTGEPVGVGGHEAAPDAQGTRPADGGAPPDRQQSSQNRHWGTGKNPRSHT